MDLKTLYSIKVFEKLGAPLVSALAFGDVESPKEDAEKLAELLNVSVKLANALAHKFDIQTPEDGDAIRLSLACVVSQFVSQNYLTKDTIVTESDIENYARQLETLMGFMDHFELAEDSANRRLRLVDSDPLVVTGRVLYDSEQIALQTMQALIPVAEVLAEFSFGKESEALTHDVARELSKKSQQIRGELYPHLESAEDQNLVELGLLRALANVYAQAHRHKQSNLESMGKQARQKAMSNPESLIKEIWDDVDLRLGMLVTLTRGIIPNNQAVEPPVAQSPQKEQPQDQSSQSEEETKEDEVAANPMSFFKKPAPKKKIAGEEDDGDGDDDGGGGRRGGGGKGFVAHKMKMGGGMGGM